MSYPSSDQKVLQPDAYYLKSMSWHLKEISAAQQAFVAELKTTNSLLVQLLEDLRHAQPSPGQRQAVQPQQRSGGVPF